MIGKIVPRYLALTAALALLTVGLMSAVFYVQYRSLTEQLVDTSTAHFNAAQTASFERRARSRMHRIADAIVLHGNVGVKADLAAVMLAALAGSESLNGLHFSYADGESVSVGEIDIATESQPERTLLSYDVVDGETLLGIVTGSFSLSAAAVETASFEQALLAQYAEQREASLTRILIHRIVERCDLRRGHLAARAQPDATHPRIALSN